ncbi:unnamed protein product [marine sediment metagenome]|uniref:Uncharacterized protein n=1 Tax=marine sediment metagenome TaxID=412755 RepID=X1U1B6_9ZZZZ
MAKFDPTERERNLVFSRLPATKEAVIASLIKGGFPEGWIRSLIWNMRRVGQIYTYDGIIKKT